MGVAAAAAALLRLFWRAGRANRAGATWDEIVETASGRLRPAAGIAVLAATYSALPAFLLASLLAAGGGTGRTGLWIATLAPMPALLAVAAVLSRPTGRPAAAPRARRTEGAVRAARAGAMAFATLLIVSVAFGAWLLSVAQWSRQIRHRAESPPAVRADFPGELARRYRSPADPSVSPERAGQALHAMIGAGRPAPGAEYLLPPAETFDAPWLPSGIEADVGVALPDWAPELLRAAGTRGLAPAVREALARATPHPAAPLFALAARAGSADLVAARLRIPLDPRITALDVPVPDYGPLHLAAYAHVARAALALDAGDAATAERLLRDIVAVGVLLHDGAHMEADAAAGGTVARIGLEGLATLFEVSGRSEEATRLRAGLENGAGAAGQGSGAAWDALWRRTVATCVDLPALLFGPPEGFDAWLRERARHLVRRPSDAAWFELVVGRNCTPLIYL